MRRLLKRAWESPTLTTWGSLGARTFSLILVLPLILNRFPGTEFTVWSLFSTIISFQLLAELGFGVTFARVVAYAMGGAQSLSDFANRRDANPNAQPNFDLLTRILGTMRAIYRRLSFGLLVALVGGGTWALWVPAARTADPTEVWIAWAVVAGCTYVSFRSNLYSSFLQGTNHVALLRRWETGFALGGIVSSVSVLSLDGGLLPLAIANQVWTLLAAWRNRWLTQNVCEGRYASLPRGQIDKAVFQAVWPAAWRSGVGAAMSMGLVQLSGIFVAQTRDVNAANSYLLGLRIVQAINQFAMAPFYSQLPALGRLYAAGKLRELVSRAARGMGLAYWTFIVPSVLAGWLGPTLLIWVRSQTPFPSLEIWVLLCAGFLVERYGAMHIQMYSLTNHVIWHVANGVTGTLMVLLWLLFVPRYGLVAIPAGTLVSYLGFYAWFTSRMNHLHYRLRFPSFDLCCLLRMNPPISGHPAMAR
jgi:hypothetical protein